MTALRRMFRFVALIAALALGASSAAAATTDVRELVRQGLEKMKSGDFDGALLKFKDAQIESPDSAEIQFNIGLCHYKLKNWAEADKAFALAEDSPLKDIEKKAAFHRGNCATQEGKLEEALKHYDRALDVDPKFADAQVNREYVVRKMKELARQKKEQDDKKEKEKEIIEKLQAIVKALTQDHAATRYLMLLKGMSIGPTKIAQLEEALNVKLPESAPTAFKDETEEAKVLEEFSRSTEKISKDLDALVEEARARLEAPESAPATGPGAPEEKDPRAAAEKENLKKALPFLSEAQPPLAGAKDAFWPHKNWQGAHDGQEAALDSLVKALNELIDELAKIIVDEIQLAKDTMKRVPAESQPTAPKPLEKVTDLAKTQDGLKGRTQAFAKGVEQQLKSMQKDLADPSKPKKQLQPGDDPSGSPEMQAKRIEEALGHLNEASNAMTKASESLRAPEYPAALESEKTAIEELVKAREKLSPPQKNDGGEKGDQGEKKNEEEKKDPKDDKNGQKPDDQKQKNDAGKKDQPKPDKKDEKLSEDQIKKMLERARQKERDQRRENKDAEKVSGGGVQGGKDW